MTSTPRAALICLGDELLDGRVSDLNAATVARALETHHMTLVRVTFERDDPATIISTLRAHSSDPDISLVIVTGGLGPTGDDRTRQAVAKWLDVALALDDDTLAMMRERFASRGRTMSPNNLIQAHFPHGAHILPTQVGTASGFMVDHTHTRLVFLPGVPREVSWFMSEHLETILADIAPSLTPTTTRTFTLFGKGESAFEQMIEPLPEEASTVSVGWRAHDPLIEVKLSSTDLTALDVAQSHLLERSGRYIIARDHQEPFARLGEKLLAEGGILTCAESCTGGLIAAAATDIPGSSWWFGRSFVTYSNQSKSELVGVLASTLEAHGAVSPQTVVQMASGARRTAKATHAIAVSGIAGPGGGTPQKPVGTVHFAISCPHGTYHHHALMHGRSRAQVRHRSVYIGLSMLLWSLDFGPDSMQECPVLLTGPHQDDAIWQDQGIELSSPHSSKP